MSRSTMKLFMEDGSACDGDEYRNGWGSGPFIWDALCRKYLPLSRYVTSDEWTKLFALDDKVMQAFERNVLHLTYDRAVIMRSGFSQLAQSLRQFHQEFRNDKVVCHLTEMANSIDEIPEEFIALGFRCTSVSEDLFGQIYTLSTPGDDAQEAEWDAWENSARDFNLNTDDHTVLEMQA